MRKTKRVVELEPMDCTECGAVHTACHAHNRAGSPCGKQPKDGSVVCFTHGGKAPQVLEAGAARVERALVIREVAQVMSFRGETVPEDGDLVAGLVEEYRRTWSVVRHLQQVVERLDDDTAAGPGGSRRVAVEWELWQTERKHLTDLAVAMARLGLEEKRLALDEALADDVADTLLAGLEAAGLTPEQMTTALEAMAAHRARAGS